MTVTATPTETPVLFEELDHREADRIEVSLLWNRATDRLTVFVSDAREGTCFELPVDAGDAREVFEHPFAHAAYRGLEL